MSDSAVTQWTDSELDAALVDLATALDANASLRAVRDRTISAAANLAAAELPARAPRRRRVAIALAAAACVLGVGVVALPDRQPASSAEAVALLLSAAAGVTPDPQPAPGQFTRITRHSWNVVTEGGSGMPFYAYRWENVSTVWRPTDYRSTWLEVDEAKHKPHWVVPAVAPDPLPDPVVPPSHEVHTAACGNFYGNSDCDSSGSWQVPTQRFIAALPRDPAKLYAKLRRDAPDNGRGDAEYLVYAADALRSGLLPADLRVALYQALTRIKGLTVRHGQVTLDGQTGTALSINDGATVQEMVIDPVTGAFIGERSLLVKDEADGLKAGTLLSSSSMHIDLVDGIGK